MVMALNSASPKIQLRARLWPALLLLLAIVQLLFPDKVWTALLVGLGGAWLIAYLWAWSLADGLRLSREMRFGWAHVGDHLEERFTLTNTGLAPALWVEIIDHSTLPNYAAGRVIGIGGDTRNTWTTRQVCNRRGLFTLGPTQIRTGDPLGFFRVSYDLPGTAVLMVTPPVVPLPEIDVTPGGRVGEGKRARPDPLERTVSAGGVRQYQSGDPLRWIHWPLSIRYQELYVRNFDATPSSDWWIFLDLDASVQTGSGFESTEEHAVILAASLADRGLRQGHAVGLAAVDETQPLWLPPRRSADQRLQILRALALARPGKKPLADLLLAARPALQRGASLIVITPSLQRQWVEALAFYVHNRLRPTVLWLDPASYGAEVNSKPVQTSLVSLGVPPYVIRRELLDLPEARPGHEGEWQWRVTGFGRAIPLRKPADLSWHKVGG
jgi:uncharacterized protein (DUF58 family)